MKFGCHLSIKEGYLAAAKQAYAWGAAAFQYFPKNPRSLTVKTFNEDDAHDCQSFCREHSIVSVSHSPYPTNLTPLTKEKQDQVVASLLNDLVISEACGSIGVVVHFGKKVYPADPLSSYHLMIDMLNRTLQQWNGRAKILLENHAGIPGSMGTTIEELVQVRNLCAEPEKIGFCLDTCHAFASGLWNGDNWEDVMKRGMKLGYFDELDVIHLNNSKYGTGSGKDRHATIFGSGYITENQFDQIMQTKQLEHIPFILETPKEEIPHEREIRLLQSRWSKGERN